MTTISRQTQLPQPLPTMLIELDSRPTATTGRTFKVRLTRPIFIAGVHHDAGQVATISEALAIDADAEFLAEIAADGTERPLPKVDYSDLPALREPAPIAADIPAPLRDFAKAEAKVNAARDWRRRIEKVMAPPAGGARVTVGDGGFHAHAKIRDLHARATTELAALSKAWNSEMLGAGISVIEAVDRANALADEAREIGFKIFAARLAPLGLASCKIHDLFLGSALHARFSTVNRIGGLGRFFGFVKGKQIIYTEGNADTFASYIRMAGEIEEKAKRLIAEGQKELARVEKVMNKEAA